MHGIEEVCDVGRALANNMVLGTSTGWSKTLSLVGVGYRASTSGQTLTLNLGYSHPIEMEIPKGIEVKVCLQLPTLLHPSTCMSDFSGTVLVST